LADFQNTRVLYSMLESIFRQVSAEEWEVAGQSAGELEKHSLRVMSASDKNAWREFLLQVGDLQAAIGQRKKEACTDLLSEMATSLPPATNKPDDR
jgi:hypothetical protein